ncbi:MAG: winged helix-turn-helix transcriptional regulator [Nitrososphaerota archaeon]|nr:winged helix-turn-helix transcriptional regulator [Nitrososphaerota archaeon]
MWTQDKAYTDLMRELWGSPARWNTKKTYSDIARKLGVDEDTVRNRLRHLKESGFLTGWRVVPNPSLFQSESSLLLLQFPNQELKECAIPQVTSMDGVIIVANIYGNSLMVTLFDDQEKIRSQKVSKAVGKGKVFSISGMHFPKTPFRMTVTDWQIIKLMLHDAEKNIQEVAEEIAISSRTVKRRLDQMMEASAIFIMPMINQSKSGGVAYHLMVEAARPDSIDLKALVTSKVDNLVFSGHYGESGMIFGFYSNNVAQGAEILNWIKAQRGVRAARMRIIQDVLYCFEWLEKELGRFQTK